MNEIPSEGNVDQIRDILFGGQMRDYERRFIELSKRLEDESTRLSQTTDERIAQLERRMDEQFDKLNKLLRQEVGDRTQAVDDVETRLQQATRTLRGEFQGGLQALDEEVGRKDERQRDGLQQLRTLLTTRATELNDAINRVDQLLRGDKVSKGDLAGMMKELALRLTGEFELPTGR